jgi:hypothetical protein
MGMAPLELQTPFGPARAHLTAPSSPGALLVLGHGAGGGVEAPDLVTAARAAGAAGLAVARVEQPYRVAGRRSPASGARLDEAWVSVVKQLNQARFPGLAVLTGGRSSGARVACRTAAATGAAGVLCLAFPLLPPPRRGSARAPSSRQPELDAVPVPVLVVQGENDRFGMPPPGPRRQVAVVPGDHALRGHQPAVSSAVSEWLAGLEL